MNKNPASQENKKSSRPNDHRAWYVDSFVIDFLWKKGWNCCKVEACDWWHDINQHLKKEFFTSEQEWKNFKEKGFYPAKHKDNWTKLKAQDQFKIEKHCWDSSRNRYHQEQLMAFTLSKLKEYEKQAKENE